MAYRHDDWRASSGTARRTKLLERIADVEADMARSGSLSAGGKSQSLELGTKKVYLDQLLADLAATEQSLGLGPASTRAPFVRGRLKQS